MHRFRRSCSIVLVAAFLGAACGGDDDATADERPTTSTTAPEPTTTTAAAPAPPSTATPVTSTAPTLSTTVTTRPAVSSTTATTGAATCALPAVAPAGATGLADVKIRLEEVARLDQPLAVAQRVGDPRLFVAEKRGRVRSVCGRTVTTVLDISGEVSLGGEQGLLGLAFAPSGDRMYVSFTDRDGNSRLWEYGLEGDRADPSTRREVLRLDQPYANHNGGQILFGPDGLLYVFFGDGGSGGDPERNGLNLGSWLGKILRIQPLLDGTAAYTVPPDNPFVSQAGAKPEIWAYGLRNPWRSSFDRATGDLWIGDVGQNKFEEVNFRPSGTGAGANYGWSAYEGKQRFNDDQPEPGSHAAPILTYPTKEGCAVTGGYVYRGAALPGLSGAYVFGDYCNGRLQAVRVKDGKAVERRDLGVTVDQLSSFGESETGDLFALSLAGPLLRIVPG